ncbi:hypothetical protein GCM10009613_40270 [Pseudonocardia kongjuensis]|uniref:HTH araC/xylS-type domain-containing protein n=1 Tax=Pseudonocardia kongjuensis TaxID=102227 RepID=A0ABP4IRW1_9PSEU
MRDSAGTGRSEPHSGPDTRLDTTDIEYARAVVGEAYCPHTISVRGAPARFHAVQSSLSDGPVALDELRYGTECDVVPIRPLSQVYCIMQPASGAITVSAGPACELLVPGRSVVLDAEIEFRMRWHDDVTITNLRFDRTTFDTAVADVVGQEVAQARRFLLACPRSERDARLWRSGLRLAEASLRDPGLSAAGPLWRAELHRHLAELLVATHPSAGPAGTGSAEPAPPSSVARVIDHLNEHAGEPFSARALARAAGTSVRSMQEAVRRELQTSPLQALIRVRLAKARAELAAAEPGAITVADVATRWGFGNLGRFARRYAEEFGELPSETLRGRR